MELFWKWFEGNWFNLVQTTGIIVGIAFTGVSLRREAQSRRFSNLISLKAEHRELWNIVHENPRFSRVFNSSVDLLAAPMTNEEEIFLRQMIVHFAVGFELVRDGTILDIKAVRRDVAEIFSLPLPKHAFDRVRHAQSPDFVKFVETALERKPILF